MKFPREDQGTTYRNRPIDKKIVRSEGFGLARYFIPKNGPGANPFLVLNFPFKDLSDRSPLLILFEFLETLYVLKRSF